MLMTYCSDGQASHTSLKSEFFEHFNINSQVSPHFLKTCVGVIETSGRRPDGFQIEWQ